MLIQQKETYLLTKLAKMLRAEETRPKGERDHEFIATINRIRAHRCDAHRCPLVGFVFNRQFCSARRDEWRTSDLSVVWTRQLQRTSYEHCVRVCAISIAGIAGAAVTWASNLCLESLGGEPGGTSGPIHGLGYLFSARRREGLIADQLVLQLGAFLRSLDLLLELTVRTVSRTLTTKRGGKQDTDGPKLSRIHSTTQDPRDNGGKPQHMAPSSSELPSTPNGRQREHLPVTLCQGHRQHSEGENKSQDGTCVQPTIEFPLIFQ